MKFSERLALSEELWARWHEAHDAPVRESILSDDRAAVAFRAGVFMAVEKLGHKS